MVRCFPTKHMKKLFSLLLGVVLLMTLVPAANAQQLPTVSSEALNGLTGYTTSYISGGSYNGSILVVGGVRNGVYQNDALLYNPSTGQVETPDEGAVKMGTYRAFHTATTLSDGRILIFGGESAPGVYPSVAELFDPATFSFQPLSIAGADLPHIQRKRHAATFFYIFGESDQYVLISGGCTGVCGTAETFRDTIIYKVSDGTFISGPLMNSPRHDHGSTYLPAVKGKGVVMQIGGADPEYLDIGTFTKTPGSGQFVQNASAKQLVDENQVLLNNSNTTQADTTIFSKVPEAVTKLLEAPKVEQPAASPNAEVLQKQLQDLTSLEKSLSLLRRPGSLSVQASDSRGRTAVSGFNAFSPRPASTASGQTLGDSAGRAMVLAQQEKLARMLRGDFSSGTGMVLPQTPQSTYDSAFAVYIASLSENRAAFLQSLPPSARDSDGDGISDTVEQASQLDPFKTETVLTPDIDSFRGALPTGPALWPTMPPLGAVCAAEGALWGRATPGEEVGIFQQTIVGTRFQLGRAIADGEGFFVAPLTASVSDSALNVVIRTKDTQGAYQYSQPRSLRLMACLPGQAVMLDRVRLEQGQRLIEGRATPGSLVFLSLSGHLIVTQADDQGDFTAELTASLPAGTTTLQAWSVLNGESAVVRSYPLEIPLQSTASGSLLGAMDASLHAAAEIEDNAAFWWIYTLGILAGVGFLGTLAFNLRRRYSRDGHFNDYI